MIIIVIILNSAVLFTLSWYVWKRQDALRKLFWPALVFKICCGISLGLLYTYYYSSGDTFSFFQDGSSLSTLARSDLGGYIKFLWSGDESFPVWSQLNYSQHRSVFFAKLISVVNLLTFDNYWITSIYFSLISFFGALYLSRRIIEFFPDAVQATGIALLFFPSVVFWSSGVIKEAIALPGIFFLAGVFLSLWHKRKLRLIEWILLPLVIWCVWNLKYFYFAVFLPIAVTTLVTKVLVVDLLKNNKWTLQFLVWLFLFGVSLFSVSFFHPNFRLNYLPEVIVMNNRAYTRLSSPDNLVHFDHLEPNVYSIAQHSPKALLSGIFRPGIWEVNSVLKFSASVENLVLMVFFAWALLRWRRIKWGEYRLITFAVMVYIGLLCILLTLSTPNLGTLVRYRIGFIPFLVFILLNGNDLSKKMERLFQHLVRHN